MSMEKTFDPAEAEARISAAWEKAGAFRAGAHAKPGAEAFCIMIPPPNVTGALHVGHAFNVVLQDILVRWHRMRGFDTLWQPGQDHAGIATQLVVERKLAEEGNMRRQEMGREAFLRKVWEWKAESGGTIVNQLKRLGASCDWERNAFTMSGAPGAPAGEEGNFHDAVIRVFVDMYRKGLIYRGKRLVNWDPHFETAISDLEVENIEVAGHMWHFRYPLANGASYRHVEKDAEGRIVVDEVRDYISIATTRPETMLGDGAVAVHPSDARYAPIVGMLCEIPVGPKEHRRLIPIITDDYPDPAFGSGAVKITGAHDFNDHAVARRNGIPCYRLMDTKGALRSDGLPYAQAAARAREIAAGAVAGEAEVDALNLVPEAYRGLDRFEARRRVVADIEADGLMSGVEAKPIMQPFGDRSKVVIEPMLTDQWFVDTAKIVGPALEAVRKGDTVILPESGEKTYYHWLENIEPWCISRQLWWGHQIPVWYGMEITDSGLQTTSGERVFVSTVTGDTLDRGNRTNPDFWFCAATDGEAVNLAREKIASVFGVSPNTVDVFPFDIAAAERVRREDSRNCLDPRTGQVVSITDDLKLFEEAFKLTFMTACRKNGRIQYAIHRDPDVLDTWFSSGLWPIGTLGWPEKTPELKRYFPTSVLVTGQDILFFWVARMMMMQLAVVGEVPFRTVYLHGLVRDEKGEKMSKTKGNVIDPLEVIGEFGTDALRFSLAQLAVLGGMPKLSTERIRGNRNFGTKLWNACRFAEMNGVFAEDRGDGVPGARATVNRWIIGEVGCVREEVDAALGAYRFNEAAQALYAFVWGVVCDWYVEFAKPLLTEGDEAGQAETRAVMAWVLDQCLILLHPFMPFLTEELWALSGRRAQMCVHADWPTYGADLVDPAAEAEMRWTIALIEAVRSARAQMNVPAGAQVPLLVLDADAAARGAFARNEALIRRLARLGEVGEVAAFPKGTVTLALPGATYGLPLAGVVDVGAETARIGKAIEKLGREIAGLRGRLGNPGFVASAPAEVVAEARANLALREAEAAQLGAALARLAEIG